MRNLIINDYHKNLKGTNQYKVKRSLWKNTYWNLLFLPLLFGISLGVKTEVHNLTAAHADYVSPLPTSSYQGLLIVSPTPVTSEKEQIKQYIRDTFGKDADKAFLLLACENSKLDPNMVNTFGNTPEGSRDIGVFSINEYWQKIQAKFLFNWKVNVLVAKQLFDENHKSFKMWQCGKDLGI